MIYLLLGEGKKLNDYGELGDDFNLTPIISPTYFIPLHNLLHYIRFRQDCNLLGTYVLILDKAMTKK
jgi:hypothetical protein